MKRSFGNFKPDYHMKHGEIWHARYEGKTAFVVVMNGWVMWMDDGLRKNLNKGYSVTFYDCYAEMDSRGYRVRYTHMHPGIRKMAEIQVRKRMQDEAEQSRQSADVQA